MSMFHYIAASRELPTGSFGGRKPKAGEPPKVIRFNAVMLPKGSVPLEQIIDLSDVKDDEIKVYETYEDAAGICIQSLEEWNKGIKTQFKNHYVYQLSASWGSFSLNEKIKNCDIEHYKANIKCINELSNYIRRNIKENEEIEIYTCWANEEGEERNHNLDTVIDLKTFNIGDNFEFKERQYILVRS